MIISSHAEHRRTDYRFERQQSRETSAREWEDRIPAIKSLAPHIALVVGACLLLVITLRWF